MPASAPIYTNAEECEAVLEPVLRRHGREFSQVLAKCLAVDASFDEQDGKLVWWVDQNGDLIALAIPVAAKRG